ncbi:hypothetical protein BTR14_01620 [Rhizobium rhizosphaerae]|uniref:Transposase n=1 Tax=Xaviernesmea rhizosphaerae TaxID=1672749 RepID=A0ABX3PIG8_9HYPH|nr:hypothetical protein [Xaviernesmea rhizosphaerae]OQP88182.1 hypothetical protein BTR14_01620 [Xaviernesmea rhizosphaerae]
MSGPKLSPAEVERIENLLVHWEGRLTWELVVLKATAVLRRTITRQSLYGHGSVARAFKATKTRQREQSPKTVRSVPDDVPPDLAYLQGRVENLQNEVAHLRNERNNMLELFAIWQHNARTNGLSEAKLNAPLSPIDRNSSE